MEKEAVFRKGCVRADFVRRRPFQRDGEGEARKIDGRQREMESENYCVPNFICGRDKARTYLPDGRSGELVRRERR